MSTCELTSAEALVWVIHLIDSEESALRYAWPRSEEQLAQANALYDLREQVGAEFVARANGDADGAIWQSAFAKWDSGKAGAK